ncbi:MAG: hypothetical protein PVF68_06395 [Acidobacteriota bacterium]|jgi:hypothetical protein
MSPAGSAAHRMRREQTAAAPSRETAARLSLNDRLERERDRERVREMFRAVGLGVLVLVPLLLHVWQQVTFVETAYHVAELRARRQELEKSLRILRLERASLESLERVEGQARRAGLVQPPPEAVVQVLEETPEPGVTP